MMRHITHTTAKPRAPRRPSVEIGKEGRFWSPMPRRAARRIVLGARKYEWVTRRPGQREGALGSVALEVLDYMANDMKPATGRLEPGIRDLCRVLRRSRDAVMRALARLEAAGFLARLRRWRRTETAEEGLCRRVARNAYRLLLPPRAARLLPEVPLPDDVAQALADRAAEEAGFLAQLDLAELPRARVEDAAFAAALATMGNNVMAR